MYNSILYNCIWLIIKNGTDTWLIRKIDQNKHHVFDKKILMKIIEIIKYTETIQWII